MYPDSPPYVLFRDIPFPAQLTLVEHAVATVAVSAGGSGYVVGDTITLTGGTFSTACRVQVLTLSGSAVATVALIRPGAYSVQPSNPVAQGATSGVGVGATFTLTFSTRHLYTWRGQYFDTAGDLVQTSFPRFGGGTVNPALEMNNALVTVPVYVWLRVRGGVGGVDYYDFEAPAGSDTFSLMPPYAQINFYGDTVSVTNTRFAFTASQFTVNNLTINPPRSSSGNVTNFGGVTINSWLKICGWQEWCCATYTFTGPTIQDWMPPGPATVFPILPYAGGTTISSIVPIANMTALQVSLVGRTGSDTTATTTFPYPCTAGNTIIAKVLGNCTATLGGQTMADAAGNAYTQDMAYQDAGSGLYAQVWRASNIMVVDPMWVRFDYSGSPGVIELVAEEVSGLLLAAPVDQIGFGFGSSSVGSIGGLVNTLPYEYFALAFASNDTTTTAPITRSDGMANLYEELDGAAYLVGSSDYHASSDTTGFAPSWTLEEVADWVAVAVTYKTRPGPQLLVFTNNSADPLVLVHNGDYTAGLSFPLFLPTSFGDAITLNQYDSLTLWMDECDEDAWRVLQVAGNVSPTLTITSTNRVDTDTGMSTITVGEGLLYLKGTGGSAGNDSVSLNLGVESQDDSTTLVTGEPILDFVSSDTTALTITVSDDPTNHRAKVTFAPTTGSSTPSGARVECSNWAFEGDSANSVIGFTSTTYDTDSYTIAGLSVPFVVTNGGYYHIGGYASWTDGRPVFQRGMFIAWYPFGGGGPIRLGASANSSSSPTVNGGANNPSCDMRLGPGDTISFQAGFFEGGGSDTVTLEGAAWIHKIGDL